MKMTASGVFKCSTQHNVYIDPSVFPDPRIENPQLYSVSLCCVIGSAFFLRHATLLDYFNVFPKRPSAVYKCHRASGYEETSRYCDSNIENMPMSYIRT